MKITKKKQTINQIKHKISSHVNQANTKTDKQNMD